MTDSITPTPAGGGTEQIIEVPISQLHDSPLQYRTTYSDATIAEIAATIVDTGRIHQPLVVRLRYPNPLFRDAYDAQDGFEIVFGHTRRRAAEAAGKATAPCVLRNLTDAQVRAAQAAENIARADVHPLEEAAGFQAILSEDQITADELAATLGKSRSYVYGRLKLLALCPEVRQAVLSGEIGTEIGLLVARVGNAKMQGKALARIRSKGYEHELKDGGKSSFRRVQQVLREYFTLDLASAIFDIEDEGLLLSAGHCMRCPKRSGNDPTFADVVADKPVPYSTKAVGANVCTDPDCFDAKRKAHLAREAAKLEAEGKAVVTGNKARAAMSATGELKGAYVELKKVRGALKQAKAAGADQPTPAVVLVQDQRTGKTVEAVLCADLQALGAAVPAPPSGRPSYGVSPEEQAEREAAAKKAQQRMADENAKRRALLDQVRAATRSTERSAFDLRLVAQVALAGVQWADRPLLAELWNAKERGDDLAKRADSMDLADLTQLLLDCALVGEVRIQHAHYLSNKPEALLAAAKHYGISTPSTAGASAKKAAAGAGAGQRAKKAKAQAQPEQDSAGCADANQTDDAGAAGGDSAQLALLEPEAGQFEEATP